MLLLVAGSDDAAGDARLEVNNPYHLCVSATHIHVCYALRKSVYSYIYYVCDLISCC